MKKFDLVHLYKTAYQAFLKFGKEKQMRQLQEECAELIVAINHHLRGRDPNLEETTEEIADILIVLNQILVGLDIDDKVDNQINIKLQKLDSKLNQPWQPMK